MRTLKDPAYRSWCAICSVWEIPAAIATRTWPAIAKATNAEAQALRYALARSLLLGARASVDALLGGPARPEKLMDLFEQGVQAQWITRADASVVENAILRDIDHRGKWVSAWGVHVPY